MPQSLDFTYIYQYKDYNSLKLKHFCKHSKPEDRSCWFVDLFDYEYDYRFAEYEYELVNHQSLFTIYLSAAVPSPSILIIKPYNIIFAEIASGLHLNQLQRYFSRIGQTVHCSKRYISRLILSQDDLILTDRDLCRSLDHNPVLSAMKVLL